MKFEVVCRACGHVLRTVSAPSGRSPESLIAHYERKVATFRCPCGRVAGLNALGEHGADVVLRDEGDLDVGRGAFQALRGLHKAHVARGGRYGPPAKRKPIDRRDPPGTVTVQTPRGPVKVPPGRVEVVGSVVVDTRGGRVSVSPVPSVPSDPPAKIPPNDRRPSNG